MRGFTFQGEGKLDKVDVFTTKNGKEVVTAIVAVAGEWPQLVPVKCFGDLATQVKALRVGCTVKATGFIGGREYNGKVYPDIKAKSIDVLAEGAEAEGAEAAPATEDVMPF